MNLLRRWMTKLFFLIDRRRFTNELDEEMVFHREQAQREFIAEGMMPEAARYAAMRQFGNGLLLKQRSHEVMEFSAESVAHDLRYALRQLAGNRGFTVVMLVTLALSIGANSAIFSVIQAVLFKPLPYPRADRIMRLFLSNASYPKFPLNPFDFRDFRARSKSFESLAAFTRADMQLSGSGDPVQLHAFRITSGFFRVLGLRPALGREFDFQSELPGNGLQVILSDRLWRTRFNANPDIVGRPVTFNEQQFTVVGVMPQGTEHPGNAYHSVNFGDDVDAWWPFAFEGSSSNRGSHYMDGIGRLKPGVTPEQARSEMNAIMAGIEREHSSDADWRVLVIPLYTELVGSSKRILWVLLGAVGMVLLIACANAANLLLARAAMRQREIAVRLALGASRARLVRQLLTESLVISFTGGALGLALAVVGVRGLVSILPADMPRAQEIHVSAPVFAFTLAVSILTGILFGLAPALAAARTDPKQGLQKGGRSASSSGHQSRMRGALVICEVSLACVLLIGAGLMLRSLLNLMHLDKGFEEDHALTASVSLPHARYSTDDSIRRFLDQLATNLSALPAVERAGIGSDVPWTGYDENLGGFTIAGKQPPPNDGFHARFHMATPDYFGALGIPLVSGRFFTKADNHNAPRVLLINQAMAEKYWPHEDAVGRRISFEDAPKESDWMKVVGVVGNVKDQANSAGTEPAFWWPLSQQLHINVSLVVRSKGDPQSQEAAVRDAVRRMDPQLALADVKTMDSIVSASVATQRFGFALVGMFAGLAILLAAIGTYGVIAYTVSQRTAEFGLRMALGAQRSDVLALVLRQAVRLTAAGTAVGVLAAFGLGRVLRTLIFDVSPADPLTFGVVGLFVIMVGLAACYFPARRATQADPMNSLRAE